MLQSSEHWIAWKCYQPRELSLDLVSRTSPVSSLCGSYSTNISPPSLAWLGASGILPPPPPPPGFPYHEFNSPQPLVASSSLKQELSPQTESDDTRLFFLGQGMTNHAILFSNSWLYSLQGFEIEFVFFESAFQQQPPKVCRSTGQEKAVREEAPERLHVVHEGNEAVCHRGMHAQGICRHQPNSGTKS